MCAEKADARKPRPSAQQHAHRAAHAITKASSKHDMPAMTLYEHMKDKPAAVPKFLGPKVITCHPTPFLNTELLHQQHATMQLAGVPVQKHLGSGVAHKGMRRPWYVDGQSVYG